ncbi:tetratricopeptide repeat protein [Novosphingobium marinum]|uniref:Tetratricopeptide (TPR) repeat protein n=1 Tax=Novosphingobium marinum TaxID=1514948 RepID=A0A7Y9XT98_9SPHN|nr:tetratricopeptide repeat protein [Novosphingobium marinum]NYH94104.1 tetratricopeptide (TPR) repeat protein [Novosphingobium marinum]
MTCTPDRRSGWSQRLGAALSALCLGLGLLVATGAIAEPPREAASLIASARADLLSGDAIGAEVRLRKALAQGASREDVAALMGDALIDQGELRRAGEWLEGERFSPATRALGYRVIARLERIENNLEKAGEAYDKAVAIDPANATMWVEIGRLRYEGGEHMLALEAADTALALDPDNVRALEFSGQIVRDRHGLKAALPWFEAALERSPNDISVLVEYAATLGDLGRAREMLTTTRKILEIDPGNARAYYLQAVMAARADRNELARKLLLKTGNRLEDLPGAILLQGILELRAGNHVLAREAFEKLLREQPANANAQVLLARTLFRAGDYRQLVRRFGDFADHEAARPYLLTLMGRAFEQLGDRSRAASYLDRAASVRSGQLPLTAASSEIGELVSQGRLVEASTAAERYRAMAPGNYDIQVRAGDARLALGDGKGALERYDLAARIRLPEALMLKMAAAHLSLRETSDAARLAEDYLRANPQSRVAARLSAEMAMELGRWYRARQLFEYLAANGEEDVTTLGNLSLARLRTGDAEGAEQAARQAYRMQPANPVAAQNWGLALAATGGSEAKAGALLAKARAMMGDNSLIAEGRLLLGKQRG